MAIHSKIHISVDAFVRSIAKRLAPATASASLAAALLLGAAGAGNAQTRLLMFEEAGCIYCAQWTAEVGPEYPITPEGLAAPLERLDIHAPLPDGFDLVSRPRFTPTFVLIRDGAEIGRIEGYPGEDFFWGLLARLLDRLEAQG